MAFPQGIEVIGSEKTELAETRCKQSFLPSQSGAIMGGISPHGFKSPDQSD
jgi:hypothetical protein